jgi:hypothetical protein
MLARHWVYGGVGGHGVAIVCVVFRRKRLDGWGVCDGGCLITALIACVVSLRERMLVRRW